MKIYINFENLISPVTSPVKVLVSTEVDSNYIFD